MTPTQLDQAGWITSKTESDCDRYPRSEAVTSAYNSIGESVTGIPSRFLDLFEPTFKMRPDWVQARVSRKSLLPWEAATTWIYMTEEPEVTFPIIQVRSEDASEEIWMHELVHAVRAHFNEPKYEEVIAYSTSPKAGRRFFGPLIESPWESWLLLAAGFVPALGVVVGVLSLWLWLTPLAVLGAMCTRLCLRQWTFHRACKRLRLGLSAGINPLAVLIRSSDSKIEQMAQMRPDQLGKLLPLGSITNS